MNYQITKSWSFSAAHQLDHLPPDHKCHRLHGHNYKVKVSLGALELDEDGFIVDYGVLNADLGAWINATFDHRNLNDVLAGPSTAEHLAQVIYRHARNYSWGSKVRRVWVAETDGTTASYGDA